MVTEQMAQNANKVTFLVKRYPKHTLRQIMSLLQSPPIDTNTSIWAAVDMGLVETDKVADRITLLKEPETWDFGPAVAELELKLKYAFHRVADEMESDFEETFLGNWTLGYESQDVLVAVMHLMDTGVIASYDIKDTEKGGAVNTYTFYSLTENADKHWGLNTFKKPPIPGLVEVPKEVEVVAAPIPDASVASEQPVSETAEEPQHEQPAN